MTEPLLGSIADYISSPSQGAGVECYIGLWPESENMTGYPQAMIDTVPFVRPDIDLPIMSYAIEIQIRNTKQEPGMSKLEEIYYHFHQMRDDQPWSNGLSCMRVYAITPVQHVGMDEKEYHYFSTTLVFQMRDQSIDGIRNTVIPTYGAAGGLAGTLVMLDYYADTGSGAPERSIVLNANGEADALFGIGTQTMRHVVYDGLHLTIDNGDWDFAFLSFTAF